jgi:deoxyadenosine/deoxycytidine kinase
MGHYRPYAQYFRCRQHDHIIPVKNVRATSAHRLHAPGSTMYIAISGNLGSGKTTLAKGLARELNCLVYPARPYDTTYIHDQLENPNRWTFEAQAAFLVHKCDAIREGTSRGRLFVLDRTIYEDLEVFAGRFYDDNMIDSRGMESLRRIYDDLVVNIDPPGIIIWCDCPPDLCAQRLKERPRQYQQMYPDDHLAKLQRKLADWLGSVIDIPLLRVDTATYDFREARAIQRLALQLDAFVGRLSSSNQLDLFSSERSFVLREEADMFQVINVPEEAKPNILGRLIRSKKVYLAAPFTSRAGSRSLNMLTDQRLFGEAEYIDSIPRSYRTKLLKLVRALENYGYQVFLPHRDINRWGRRAYPPSEIATRCLDAITNCDYFVGLIGESFGSHLELGVALGMNKPSVLLFADNIPTSFFGSGVSATDRVRVLRGKNILDLASKLRENDILEGLG